MNSVHRTIPFAKESIIVKRFFKSIVYSYVKKFLLKLSRFIFAVYEEAKL